MQTRNVYYAERPDDVIITANGESALIEFPVDVTEIVSDEGTQYKAKVVYSLKTRNTPNLTGRVLEHKDVWLAAAKVPEPQKTELSDVVEAINALTELVIGGE